MGDIALAVVRGEFEDSEESTQLVALYINDESFKSVTYKRGGRTEMIVQTPRIIHAIIFQLSTPATGETWAHLRLTYANLIPRAVKPPNIAI